MSCLARRVSLAARDEEDDAIVRKHPAWREIIHRNSESEIRGPQQPSLYSVRTELGSRTHTSTSPHQSIGLGVGVDFGAPQPIRDGALCQPPAPFESDKACEVQWIVSSRCGPILGPGG